MENAKPNLNRDVTWKQLISAGLAVPIPFTIRLPDQEGVIFCNEIVRIMAGKRLVAFGMWGQREVVVKLFYGKRNAKRNFERDVYGVNALLQANIPTPNMLYQGTLDKKRLHILIYEKITANSLELLWQEQRHLPEVEELLKAAIIEIATQHVLGVLQHDLHFKNFLVTEKNILTLDGGQISKFDDPLDKKISIDYVCLFLAQLGVGYKALQDKLFYTYTASRGWIVKPLDIKFYKKCMIQRNRQRFERYKKKIFRSCSAFKRMDKFTKAIVYDRMYESTEFMDVLNYPEKYFSRSDTVLLKSGRSSTVAKIMVANKPMVIKRYNLKDTWHALRRSLRSTRAVKSWRDAQHIYAAGVQTAKPIAFIENRVFGLRGKSYFIMEYIAGEDVGEYYRSYQAEDRKFSTMANQIFLLLKNLAELSLTHDDLKKSNILIENEQPFLIDLDSIREHISKRKLRKDFQDTIRRFMRNWENRPLIYALFSSIMNKN